jgi:hypothetical protein
MSNKKKLKKFLVTLNGYVTYPTVAVMAESAEKAYEYVESNSYALDPDITIEMENSDVIESKVPGVEKGFEDWTEDEIE